MAEKICAKCKHFIPAGVMNTKAECKIGISREDKIYGSHTFYSCQLMRERKPYGVLIQWCGSKAALWQPKEGIDNVEQKVMELLIQSSGFSLEDAQALTKDIMKIVNEKT